MGICFLYMTFEMDCLSKKARNNSFTWISLNTIFICYIFTVSVTLLIYPSHSTTEEKHAMHYRLKSSGTGIYQTK